MLLLDTSGGFWWCEGGIATPCAIRVRQWRWGYWHYKMANQSFFQTATSTKWQTCCGKQTSLSHLDPINPSKQFLSMFHPYLPFFIYRFQSPFIFVLLLDTSGGFWWCEGGIEPHLRYAAMALGLLALQNGKHAVANKHFCHI